MTRTLVLLLLAGWGAFGAACAKEKKPQKPAEPTAAELLTKAADTALALNSLQFRLKREGPPAVLDETTGITFTEANCRYQAPDRVGCSVKIALKNGSVLQLERVWIPEGSFMTNPLTKKFGPPPPDSKFDGAALFSKEGIPKLLRTAVQDPTLAGKEKVEEHLAYHLKGHVDGTLLNPIMAETLQDGVMYPVDIWMDTTTSNVFRMHVAEPDGSGWDVEVFGENEPVQIPNPAAVAPF